MMSVEGSYPEAWSNWASVNLYLATEATFICSQASVEVYKKAILLSVCTTHRTPIQQHPPIRGKNVFFTWVLSLSSFWCWLCIGLPPRLVALTIWTCSLLCIDPHKKQCHIKSHRLLVSVSSATNLFHWEHLGITLHYYSHNAAFCCLELTIHAWYSVHAPIFLW
jgi:hypothetical protein